MPEGAAAGSLVHYFGHVGPDSARHRMSILLFSLRFGLAPRVHCHPPGFFARLRARRAPMDRWNALKTLANPLASSPAPAPFDGITFTALGTTGGFIVTVANDPGGDPDQRQITSIGWTPTNDPTDTHTKAHRKIQANVVTVPNLAGRAPCALCVAGELNVGGGATINGTNTDPKCGGNDKYGTYTSGATTTDRNATVTGGAGGIAQNQGMSAFTNFTF